MLTATGRSEAARKASETRKRNRYEQKREEAIQSTRREYLYKKLTTEQRDAIDEKLDSSTYGFDERLEEFVSDIEFDVMDDIRTLLRDDIHPAVIITALEAGNCDAKVSTGAGGFTIGKKSLLGQVLREEEFRFAETEIDEEDVAGISYGEFDIPPALEKGGANL